jgi:hypothetical protein
MIKNKGHENLKPGYNRGLTVQQMSFVHAVMAGCTNSEAYVQAYLGGDRGDRKATYIARKATDRAQSKGVKEYIKELRAKARADSEITTKDLLTYLEEARLLASKRGAAGAAVQAIMAMHKVLGLEKSVVELSSKDNKPIINITIKDKKS